jgi:hypothetical protein
MRLRALRWGVVSCLGATLSILGAIIWLAQATTGVKGSTPSSLVNLPSSALPTSVSRAPEENLTEFYGNLGSRRHAEQQVKTLFWLAGKNGLTLTQGQYKSAFDKRGEFYTYQIMLPVNGPYPALWQFATQVLATIPFASLDEISFKRESIADNRVNANIRFTLYLTDTNGPVQP